MTRDLICIAYLGLSLINHFIFVEGLCVCIMLERQAVQSRKTEVTPVNHI